MCIKNIDAYIPLQMSGNTTKWFFRIAAVANNSALETLRQGQNGRSNPAKGGIMHQLITNVEVIVGIPKLTIQHS
jgi:hypothetical protein